MRHGIPTVGWFAPEGKTNDKARTNPRLSGPGRHRFGMVKPAGGAKDEGGDISPPLRWEGPIGPAQQLYCELIEAAYPELQSKASAGEERAKSLLARFLRLGEHLGVRLWNPA